MSCSASLARPSRPAARDLDGVALELERAPHRRQDVRLVIDDENRAARHASRP